MTSDNAVQCRGTVVEWERKPGINPETGRSESTWIAHRRPCKRRLIDDEYCHDHYEQGEPEREMESAYAQHTAI